MSHRAPAISRGVSSFIWGLVFGLYIWLGGLAVGVSGATAFVFGAVAGFLIFLLVMLYGADEPRRQARAPGPTSALIPRESEHQETRQLGSELLA